jgi:dTDP-N-acetylfucosamine:lipid II N-acetylfucosaminyltransferase
MNKFFVNEIMVLDSKNPSNKEYHNKAIFFEPNQGNLNKILAVANSADALVIYNLDFFKSQIVNHVDKRVKIIWRFFGTELYSRKPDLFLSRKSRSFFVSKIIKGKIKSIFRFFFPYEKSFYRAIKRSDVITCVFKDEYEYLIQHWNHLPRFIPLSLEHHRNYSNEIDFKLDYPKKNIVVIGNSRAFYNNHLDSLELVKKSKHVRKLNIKVLFNYGAENKYTSAVREKVKLVKVELIDSFIAPNEFIDFYGPVAAFINNSYRQLALGNVFMALHKGVKVYLNSENPTYQWLKREGLYIYNMETLENDLETGQVYLAKSEIEHNLKGLKKLKEGQSKNDFIFQVCELLNE